MTKKTLSTTKFILLYAIVVAVTVTLDQLSKILIFGNLLQGQEGNSVEILGKFLRFTAVLNEGAAFGLGTEDGANIIFFIITLVGVPFFSYFLWRSRTRSICGQLGFAFIIGGTIGNAIDRAFIETTQGMFFSGKVRDFISFNFFPPVFNVADSFLVVGVFMAVFAILLFDDDSLVKSFKEERLQKQQAQSSENNHEEN